MKIIKTVCHRDCPDTCFMDVSVDQGRIVKTRGSTDNPITRGFLCPRGTADPQRVYSSQRVLYPHVRAAGSESEPFFRVAWGTALDRIADRIQTTVATYGPESVLLYDYPGNTGLLAWQYPRRLWLALGATTTDYTLCASAGHSAIGLHYGSSYGLPLTDVARSKMILFWGNNAKVSAPHIWAMACRAHKEHGTAIVCVDPRKSPTAAAADIHIQPRPGSDVALCYGIARQLIQKQAIDQAFIDRWTTGFGAYARTAEAWPPRRVEAISGIAEAELGRIADLLMTQRPAAFMIGLGLQKSGQGAEAARAVALLPALLGQHRGFHYSNARSRDVDAAYLTGSRLARRRRKVVSQVALGARLAAGTFKFVYVFGSNPAVTLPDQNAVRRGLARDDVFVVVHDTHWSETAVRADVVLPAPTFLEKRDVTLSDHHTHCRLTQQAIDPRGESRHEIEMMHDLGRRLGVLDEWVFEDPWDALDRSLGRTFRDGGLENLAKGDVLEVNEKTLDAYPTQSGRIDFTATTAGSGAAPLPHQQDLDIDRTAFVLLNSSSAAYTHSQFTDVYGAIPAIVEIHPQDAKRLGIRDKDRVSVYNNLAAVSLTATLTDRVLPGSLWAPRPLIGLNGVPLNALVPGTAQAIGGGPVFNSTRVQVKLEDDCPDP